MQVTSVVIPCGCICDRILYSVFKYDNVMQKYIKTLSYYDLRKQKFILKAGAHISSRLQFFSNFSKKNQSGSSRNKATSDVPLR